MDEAKNHYLGFFFDPDDPRRDLSVRFKEYKEDLNMLYLHIGISYCFGPEPQTFGHLFIVKNRLPEEATFDRIVNPLLTQEEVRGEVSCRAEPLEEFQEKEVTVDSLGPFGCCDCCHTHGLNC